MNNKPPSKDIGECIIFDVRCHMKSLDVPLVILSSLQQSWAFFVQTDFGGWPNSQIIHKYVEYADHCFSAFGGRVKKWITFNEPWVFTVFGYSDGSMAPNMKDPGRSEYQAGRNVILAHAKAYRFATLIYCLGQVKVYACA